MIGRKGKGAPFRKRLPRLVLLGPQRPEYTLPGTLERLAIEGVLPADAELAWITAGWREREEEDETLRHAVGGRGVNLRLYARSEDVGERDPELARAHAVLQDRFQLLRRAYNLRLAHLMDAWSDIEALEGDPELLAPEREGALAAIRTLDAEHLTRIAGLRDEYDETFRPAERDAVSTHVRDIRNQLGNVGCVLIAGGHVASLLNRLRWFGLAPVLTERAVIAWSAGAMALADRVVLFHDRPPWGRGNAETFENGLGLASGVVPFPDATVRLRLDDHPRLARLAERFTPDRCLLLDPGTGFERREGTWRGIGGSRCLDRAGRLRRLSRSSREAPSTRPRTAGRP